jgi:hypothetical protein
MSSSGGRTRVLSPLKKEMQERKKRGNDERGDVEQAYTLLMPLDVV